MALEAQALANSIWGHGGHGLKQVKKNEGNKKHLLPFCRYPRKTRDFTGTRSPNNPVLVLSAPRAHGEGQRQRLRPTQGHPNPKLSPQSWHKGL